MDGQFDDEGHRSVLVALMGTEIIPFTLQSVAFFVGQFVNQILIKTPRHVDHFKISNVYNFPLSLMRINTLLFSMALNNIKSLILLYYFTI